MADPKKKVVNFLYGALQGIQHHVARRFELIKSIQNLI